MTNPRKCSRRRLIKTAGSAALAAGLAPAVFVPRRANSKAHKTLKILQWNHFVPEFDHWFNNVYVKEWGRSNGTEVIVDNVGMTSLNSRAAAEVAAQNGHDLFMFVSPPPSYEEHVIDHREIYEECERRYGKPVELAMTSTYNPKTGKYYGFSDSYVPDPINYRKDLWDDVGMYPDTWDDVRVGGRKIKQKHGNPVGLGLAPELDTNVFLRSLMAASGSSVQDEAGHVVLNSRQTLEALKFVKALYQEAMTDEVFAWDPSSNNRHMLAGKGSLVLNAISITRTGENQRIPVAKDIWLAKAPQGPVRRIGLPHLMDVYVIWEFAENIEGAKQFLVDYVGHSNEVFRASQFYNFPCFPDMVPDLRTLISSDPQATPADKYAVFDDISSWVTNLGHPGFANAAEDEIFNSWIISTMFTQTAKGTMSPEEALSVGDREARRIFEKWRERGVV